jgi:transposase-like protein
MARGQVHLKRLTEDEARELLEGLRWPNGPVCPHCGNCDQERIGKLMGKATRPGVHKCKECRKQFTVTVGTIFERSKVALRDWVYAFAAMCASKKGISALQLSRELGCQYKTSWFMCHRIRHAMKGDDTTLLSGTISADEAYIGGKPRNPGQVVTKMPVLTLVEKGGRARTRVECNVNAATLHGHILRNVDRSSKIVTDEHRGYMGIGKHFAGGHETVNHSARQYATPSGISSNDAESYFANLKRGIYGTFHHVSTQHLQRFVDEFDFRWNNRDVNDTERTFIAIAQSGGKRLTYKPTTKGEA